MPIREILRAVVFLHRIADDKDFLRTVDCIPDSQMQVLEEELKIRQEDGEIETVQVGRMRYQAATLSVYQDGVDKFLETIDEPKLKAQYEQEKYRHDHADVRNWTPFPAYTAWLHSSMDRATPSEGEDSSSILDGATNFTGFDNVAETDK